MFKKYYSKLNSGFTSNIIFRGYNTNYIYEKINKKRVIDIISKI